MLKQTADACTSLYSFSHLLLSPSMRGRADHFPWRKHAPPINELHRRTAPATCMFTSTPALVSYRINLLLGNARSLLSIKVHSSKIVAAEPKDRSLVSITSFTSTQSESVASKLLCQPKPVQKTKGFSSSAVTYFYLHMQDVAVQDQP
uniref:Uncharacterized protein n=1 Tax=Aegilops tauschii subsp. strangulata TaxID=200361 RepID=A0A453QNZ5_AEGTS